MGCCLIAIFGALWPRILLILIYIFSPAIPAAAFPQRPLLPIAGFIFLPATTLSYECSIYWWGYPLQHKPLALAFLAIALLSDLSQLGLFRRKR